MGHIATPMAIPATVEELAVLLRELADTTVEGLEEKRGFARQRPHDPASGDRRHDDIHLSGFLLGVCTALAMATGEQSDSVYNQLLGHAR